MNIRKLAWSGMAAAAAMVALASLRYFSLQPVVFIPGQAAAYMANLGPLLVHIAGGTTALALGPYQFLPNLRARRPRLHRTLGRVYVVAVLATGLGAFGLARIAEGGPMARLGFAVMGSVLLACTGFAFLAIRSRDIAAHRRWMHRSYAVIFSAVTFRAWLFGLTALGLPFDTVYAVGAWTSWMIDVMAAEAIMSLAARRRPVSARRSSPRAAVAIEPAET